jgi:hypothetical protein
MPFILLIRMKRRWTMNQVIYGLMVLWLLTGCSSMKIATAFSETADFSKFRTFQYKETDTTIADINPMAHQWIIDAIRREMIANNFAEVDSDPDVYVSYYGKVNEELVMRTTQVGHAAGSGSYRLRSPLSDDITHSVTTATTYRRGTLVIDIWEAGQKELVWRGTVSDSLSENPDQNAERINRGITNVFEKYPPAGRS